MTDLLNKHSVLIDMLKYKRPANSSYERAFINKYIKSIEGIQTDAYDNYYVEIGNSNIMFTAHTDSVHSTTGKQQLAYDPLTKTIMLNDERSSCLGSDDATGVYILTSMIKQGIAGLYVFFREEEVGGCGSNHAVTLENYWLGKEICVSFDRCGYSDVITHQGFVECCSSEFADQLATRLNGGDATLAYKPNDGGIFTDSANFTGVIAECTNISVGYHNEHTTRESQDLRHLDCLLEACLNLNWNDLPVKRDPSVAVSMYDAWGGYSGDQYSGTEYNHVDWAVPNDHEMNSIQYIRSVITDPSFKAEDLDDFLATFAISGKNFHNWYYSV